VTVRLFVTGAEGQVARSLREAAADDPAFVVGFGARPEFDLARPETIAPAIEAFQPDVVINAAAYTAVDKAESDADMAFAVNRDGAGTVSAAAARVGAPVIQLSTDYVFDGRKPAPYLETDLTGPTGVYGRSKLTGEAAVAAANPRHIILRTSWVFAPFGANFVRTMLRLAGERDTLRVVADQLGCPTYAPDLAAAILAVARRLDAGGWQGDYAGVTHVAGPTDVSWCGFARAIVAAGAARGAPSPRVEAIATADYPTPAARPANSRLATDRFSQVFGLRLSPLEATLADCLDRLIGPPVPSEARPS